MLLNIKQLLVVLVLKGQFHEMDLAFDDMYG